MAKRTKSCEVHSFCTTTNSRQHTTSCSSAAANWQTRIAIITWVELLYNSSYNVHTVKARTYQWYQTTTHVTCDRQQLLEVKIKVNVNFGRPTWYSTAYMSQTRDQKRFTIASCNHLLPAPVNNWTRGAASRHTTAPISHIRPLSRCYYWLPTPLRVGGWVNLRSKGQNKMMTLLYQKKRER